jgi:ABC-2 type transport system ATP-binding protein
MIELRDLTKRYGDKIAVDSVSAIVRPGVVTGFLGPNGAGKSTTMRVIVGLDRPTSGSALVNGRPYVAAPAPLAEVGALLDAKGVDKGRSARNHLLALGATVGIGARRVDEVLGTVGLTDVAGKAAGTFSLGMGQRLGIAAAMLGDPPVVVLDEPVNGLDPEGIRWVRTFARQLADEGRTVFISSHLMSEMALMADHLLVIGRGSILADCSMSDFMTDHAASYVRVKAPALTDVAHLLSGRGLDVTRVDDELRVTGLDAPSVGELAFRHGLMLHELTLVRSSLEDAFMALTADSVEYHAAGEPKGALR